MQETVKEKTRWSTEILWIGPRFNQVGDPEDLRLYPKGHRWEDQRPPQNYECEPWVWHLFRHSQALRPQVVRVSTSPIATIKQIQDRVDPNVEIFPFRLYPPQVAQVGQPFQCQSCGSVTWVEEGKYLQCRPCNRRRQKKWREGHREEKRALDRDRYRKLHHGSENAKMRGSC